MLDYFLIFGIIYLIVDTYIALNKDNKKTVIFNVFLLSFIALLFVLK